MSEGGALPLPSLPAVGKLFKAFGFDAFKGFDPGAHTAYSREALQALDQVHRTNETGPYLRADSGEPVPWGRGAAVDAAGRIVTQYALRPGSQRDSHPWQPLQPFVVPRFRSPGGGTVGGLWDPKSGNPPGTGTGAQSGDWRDYVDLAGDLARQVLMELWQRRQAKRALRDLQRLYRRAFSGLTPRGVTMPYPNTSSLSRFVSEGPSFNWGGLLGGVAQGLGTFLASRRDQEAIEGVYDEPWWPDSILGLPGESDRALSASMSAGCGSPFVAGGSALRASLFAMANPATGRLTWFRPAGKPVLFSGDFATARRVDRLARKARRRCRGGR